MQNSFENGKIISYGKFYEVMIYNVSNESVSAVFDGKGAIKYYSVANESQYIKTGASAFYINGKHIDVFAPKKVSMLGRRQESIVSLAEGTIVINQFLDKKTNGVFVSVEFQTEDAQAELKAGINVGTAKEYDVIAYGNVDVCHDNAAFYATLTKENSIAKIFLTFNETDITQNNIEDVFDLALAECEKEIAEIMVPEGLNEEEKAMFYSCYFCALENYKEKDDFKGFMAGHVYLLPMRTYYRDSYYTVLPMYRQNSDKVKNEIITLSKGIAEDGTCPSAVIADYSAYWENHYDSPSFLAIMLYDYVRFTNDYSILNEPVCDSTVYKKAEAALLKLSECEDETGLLYKEGKFNKRDWADAVNRFGYVTYDEILYARALFSLSRLAELMGDDFASEKYMERYLKTKNAIDTELWDEEKGYYINFKNEEYVEDNLSVDTVLAVLFNISDETKARRMLENMEKLLEVRNNKAVKLPDYGVMCVYPPYIHFDATYFRSSQPFEYHNGSNWPYWAAMYALAKRKYGMEYKNALCSWFTYNIEKNNFTPIEYFSSGYPDGSLLQAWSGVAAFVFDEEVSLKFWDEKQEEVV